MNCKHCKHYAPTGGSIDGIIDTPTFGECHRYPPKDGKVKVDYDDYCGEHKKEDLNR